MENTKPNIFKRAANKIRPSKMAAGDLIDTNTRGQGHKLPGRRKSRLAVRFTAGALASASILGTVVYSNYNPDAPINSYQENIEMIQNATVRNSLHDGSQYRDVKQSELVASDHYGPNDRSDHVADSDDGNWGYPTSAGGQNRTQCEFSHFAYDDPILFPDKPGGAHLHMFFGNTDVNAYTTQETLEDSGSSTCNGQELNRSGYWAPALFDGNGDIRIPEDVLIYYKGEGWGNGGPNGRYPTYPDGSPNPGSQIYERGMRNISPNPLTVPEVPAAQGGAPGQVNYKCTGNFSGPPTATGVNNIPFCDGDVTECGPASVHYPNCRAVLELEIKFWNCYDTYDESNPNAPSNPVITDWAGWKGGYGNWFQSNCSGRVTATQPFDRQEQYPSFSYFIQYVIEPGETTEGWFLSSDVNPNTVGDASPSLVASGAGSTLHGDAWWEWHDPTFQTILDNCINFWDPNAPSGCGNGLLSNGGPAGNQTPLPGPALKVRPRWDVMADTSTIKVSAQQVFNELCAPLGPSHSYSTDEHAAWCKP